MSKTLFSFGPGVIIARVIAGVVAVLVGTVALDPGGSLGLAVWLLGAFILAHTLCDFLLQSAKNDEAAGPKDSETGLREFAASFVATASVILGLLTVFDTQPFTPTIKVGIAALVTAILSGIVLVGLLLAAPPQSDTENAAWNLIRYVFNFSVWALALGLLCISTGLLYRKNTETKGAEGGPRISAGPQSHRLHRRHPRRW
jgi:hydrogenase-4 membrane subunit HyfE